MWSTFARGIAHLMCTGTTPYFPSFFLKKGNAFFDPLIASMDDEALQKQGPLLKERICSFWSKFFLLRVDTVKTKMAQLFPLNTYILVLKFQVRKHKMLNPYFHCS